MPERNFYRFQQSIKTHRYDARSFVEIFMRLRLRPLLPLALLASLSACVVQKPVVYQEEKFDTTNVYTHHFTAPADAVCEAARRTLLSQGYIIGAATTSQVDGRKSFQPDSDVHVQIAFRVVCAADLPQGSKSSSLFANAVEDRYALKKINNSASVGVGALGSLSVPFSSSDDSLVKVASQTIGAEQFYARFFQLVERYLNHDASLLEAGKEDAREAAKPPPQPEMQPALPQQP
jgi:hypothetical protein